MIISVIALLIAPLDIESAVIVDLLPPLANVNHNYFFIYPSHFGRIDGTDKESR